MRKLILTIVCATISICGLQAQKLNATQQKLKTDIFNYLRKEATNVSDHSATDIKFSYNGTTYFVSVSESDYVPMYVTLYAGFNIPSEYDKEIVAKAGQQLNLYKGVKFYSGDDYIKFQAEMFMNDSKPFTVAFKSLLGVMSTMRKSFDEEYEKAKPKYTTSSAFTSQFKQNNGVHNWPPATNKTDSKLYVAKVTVTKENTILEMVSYNGGQYQNCAIDRQCYITANGKKYTLTRAEGISYSPKYTDYPDYKTGYNVPLFFKLYFPSIPENVKYIDFAENGTDVWKISNIILDDSNVIQAESDWLETGYHKWKLVSVRCEANRTIIQKKYLPKEEMSAVYSSQEEYIEDADTGRKYYLKHSDIGFESDQYVAKGKVERYFNEEYPALPANVKRINVSSGSQYYIKNLKIR